MTIEAITQTDLGEHERPEAAHLFNMAVTCLQKGMQGRTMRHVRAVKRSLCDSMLSAPNVDARRFWHQCYLLADELEIFARR